ncbi:cystatin-2-like [Lissotriton helveticus]
MAASWMIPALVFAAVFAAVLADFERKPKILGGAESVSFDESGVQKALSFAMKEYNKASNDKFAYKVSEVVEVKRQIVAGLKYFITVKMARTTCKNAYVVVENCALHNAPEMLKTVECKFEIFTVPWRRTTEMLKRDCKQ